MSFSFCVSNIEHSEIFFVIAYSLGQAIGLPVFIHDSV